MFTMDEYENVFNSTCRVCATPDNDNMVSLIDENSGKGLSCYGLSVLTFAEVSIEKDDGLPQSMCQNCLHLLKQAIIFKMKCESRFKQLYTIKLNKHSEDNLKEKIVEFAIFSQHFPIEITNKKPPQTSLTHGSEKAESYESDLLDMMLEYDDIRVDNDESTNDNSNSDNDCELTDSDQFLDLMEKNIESNFEAINYSPRSKHKSSNDIMAFKRITPRVRRCGSPNSRTCKICGKLMGSMCSYRQHMTRHGAPSFVCEHCGKAFKMKSGLQFHLVATHGTGKYFSCQQCNFRSARFTDLTEHQRIHTGERPFACDKCGLTFRRRQIYKKHLLHHDIKKVQCVACPRSFHTQSDLAAHTNSMHSRRYVFACGRCDVTYAKASSVRRHLAEAHRVPPHEQGRITRINKVLTSTGTTDHSQQ